VRLAIAPALSLRHIACAQAPAALCCLVITRETS
jgi:hypothetical protein